METSSALQVKIAGRFKGQSRPKLLSCEKGANEMRWAIRVLGFLALLVSVVGFAPAQEVKDSVPTLLKKLKNKDAKVRRMAAEDLGHVGAIKADDAKEALDPLLDAAKKDSDSSVRMTALTAIAKLDPDPEKAVPVLRAGLKDKDAKVRIAAANALGNMGSKAKDALPTLQELAKDSKDKQMMRAAGMAVRSIRESGKKN